MTRYAIAEGPFDRTADQAPKRAPMVPIDRSTGMYFTRPNGKRSMYYVKSVDGHHEFDYMADVRGWAWVRDGVAQEQFCTLSSARRAAYEHDNAGLCDGTICCPAEDDHAEGCAGAPNAADESTDPDVLFERMTGR